MRKLVYPALAALALLAIGCGTDPQAKADKLEFTGTPVPSPFVVGDTSGLWTASKTTIGSNGRANTIDDYTTFTLVSSDPGVVDVVDMRFLVAVKAGSADVSARDNRSDLTSESSVKVTVVAAP